MLKPTQLVHQCRHVQALFHSHKPFLHGSSPTSFGLVPVPRPVKKTKLRIGSSSGKGKVKAVAREIERSVKVKAIVSVKPTIGGFLSNIKISKGLDDIQDLLGKSLLIELVGADLDPKTGKEKETIKAYAHRKILRDEEREINYEANFEINPGFGKIGAILMENEHRKEMFVVDVILQGLPGGPTTIHCESWLHSKFDNPQKRVFFTSKTYLPSETPSGLRRLREKELEALRGNGEGERQKSDRIYDYDVYNDLGDPTNLELQRPTLGGKDYPYPRRCRTGRPRSQADPASELFSRIGYVPRDEAFAEVKQLTFSVKTLYSGLHALVPSIQTLLEDRNLGFPYFRAIDKLYDEGIRIPSNNVDQSQGLLKTVLPRLIKAAGDLDDALQFEIPETMHRDKFFWFRDEEFARQTLAGLNPCSIQLVTEWPLMSKLDPEIYGPQESAITTELVEEKIGGHMSVQEAIEQKKLFMLDYHDMLLPYVSKVRELEGTTLYGSRTLFFLTKEGTLRAIAIELTRPKMDDKPFWREVRSPCYNATGLWLWRLSKAHVLAHDSGFHQLVSHWLRTHCATEPYIIASNRQLSAMHPIYRLLHPHFRYTMEINALARDALVNAGGIIETSFSPGKYSIQLSSDAYDKLWRFDHQSLPGDLISRGMAVEDPNSPHGLKLTIEDYPFAADGLILWDSLQEWITDYVSHFYVGPTAIESDKELQAWWTEIRTVGHGDKKDEPWWPKLETPQDLIGILTTITWVTSGHHAAVNFGQYDYAGYFPNRPTIARTNMPTEDASPEFWERFMEKPELALLDCFPSQIQAATIMAVLDILSSHSTDEEYIGDKIEPAWRDDPVISAAFEMFNGRLKELEGIIDARNIDQNLKNRCGAGVVPYKLLKPFSGHGVTGQGVPYSISI